MKAAADGAEDSSPAFLVPDLTPAQKVARMGGLGGSDAERIMAGNWYRLWAEKTKRVAAEDLTRTLPVQMGKVTEAFNAQSGQHLADRLGGGCVGGEQKAAKRHGFVFQTFLRRIVNNYSQTCYPAFSCY